MLQCKLVLPFLKSRFTFLQNRSEPQIALFFQKLRGVVLVLFGCLELLFSKNILNSPL